MTLTEIIPLLDKLDEFEVDYSVGIRKGRKIGSIWISELRATHPNYRPVLSALTSAFGRLDKEVSCGVQSWKAEKDGTTLTMYRVASCKIVGYKTIEVPKKIEVETEEMETEEVPIYDCAEVEA